MRGSGTKHMRKLMVIVGVIAAAVAIGILFAWISTRGPVSPPPKTSAGDPHSQPRPPGVISRSNNEAGLMLRFRYDFGAEDLMRRSDQWSFLQKGIPAVFFFSGLHPDYHTPRDTAEKINYTKLEKVARLVYLTTQQLSASRTKPQFVKASATTQR